MSRIWILCVLSFASLPALRARAESAPAALHFSDQGRKLVAGSIGGDWSSREQDWSVWLEPSLGYFLLDRFALSLEPGFAPAARPSRDQPVCASARSRSACPRSTNSRWLSASAC